MVDPHSAQLGQSDDGPLMVPVDLNLVKLAIGLHLGNVIRLWLAGSHFRGTRVYAEREDLVKALTAYSISYTRRNFKKLLERGSGLFWNLDGGRVYFMGWKRLSVTLAALAVQRSYTGLLMDKPGVRRTYLSLDGKLGDFEARVFAAWIDDKTIARETQEQCWNRTRQQLWRWQQRAKVRSTPNTGYTFDSEDVRIPRNGTTYRRRVRDGGKWKLATAWPLPNTYHAPEVFRECSHKGQGSKVRRAVNAVLSPLLMHEGTPAGRCRYCKTLNEAKRAVRRAKEDSAIYQVHLQFGGKSPGEEVYALLPNAL
jgi:hypothetical protein